MIEREVSAAETDQKAGKKEDREKKRPQVVAEDPVCPICAKSWNDHNLVRVRECMPKLEEALRLAEQARIRASLS
jgi:hypothetical protein